MDNIVMYAAAFGIVGCYFYSVYLVSRGRMVVHVPDERSGAEEGVINHSLPPLVTSSQDG